MPRSLAHAATAALLSTAVLFASACTESPNAPSETATQRPDLAVEALALTTVSFASDPSWTGAQNVCLNAASPSNCPAGATLYGYSGSGWGADRSSIPGANWIWAAGVTGATAPAYPAQFLFSRTFTLTGIHLAGSISVASDDFAEVLVNGQSVGSIGSVSDASLAGAASSALTTFDIGPFLTAGSNLITVRGANGNFGCGSGPYSCNPAGVVFGGSFSFQADPATKEDCKTAGWESFGFRNQGQCVRLIETGEDSR
jgi:hypothetical protein